MLENFEMKRKKLENLLDNIYLRKNDICWEKGLGLTFLAKKHILGMIMRFEDVESIRIAFRIIFIEPISLKHKNFKTY